MGIALNLHGIMYNRMSSPVCIQGMPFYNMNVIIPSNQGLKHQLNELIFTLMDIGVILSRQSCVNELYIYIYIYIYINPNFKSNNL